MNFTSIKNHLKDRAVRTIADPINNLIDTSIADISSTIGSFIIRNIRGKFQRTITFRIGNDYTNNWMEEALYGILYKYNDIRKAAKLELGNKHDISDGTGMYYHLGNGTHSLKYRKWNIMLCIETVTEPVNASRIKSIKEYTIITYDLDPNFATTFEQDMLKYRNSLLRINKDSPTLNIYMDEHESDGYTYWCKSHVIPKRRLDTIYIPREQKKILVDTINNFFASKEYYNKHGIPHNLKILLHGPAGPQPLDVIIPTPTGNIKMGDLKPGDYVFAYNGYPTKIEEIYEYNDLEVFEVEFNDGRKVLCGEDHKWPIISSRGNFVEKSVKEMMEHGIVNKNNRHIYKVPLCNTVEYPHKDVPIDPWVLGVFIGNGCLREEKLTLSAPNSSIPKIIANKYGFVLKHYDNIPNNYNWMFYYKNGLPVKTKDFFKDIPELINSYSKDKIIPEDYIINDPYVKLRLIQGLMDTDGSIVESKASAGDYKRYDLRFSSTSENLAQDFMTIINSLGYSCTIHIDKRIDKYRSKYCAEIYIKCFDDNKFIWFKNSFNKFIRAIKCHYREHDKTFTTDDKRLSIVNIRSLGYKTKMRCLHIEDESHIYLTTGYIPTCNSGKSSIVKMIASEWNMNLYECTGGKNGRFIPNALTQYISNDKFPLFSVSDIDKYPFLINEADINLSKKTAKEEELTYSQCFNNMINALDGIASGEDRIILITTNHIEKFSKTLLRPGRIDLQMEINYVTPETFRKYAYDFYGVELPKDIKLTRNNISIADLQFDVIFSKMEPKDFIKKYVK